MLIKHWSGVSWYGAYFDNEAEARAWGEARAIWADGTVVRWDVSKVGDTWFTRVHV